MVDFYEWVDEWISKKGEKRENSSSNDDESVNDYEDDIIVEELGNFNFSWHIVYYILLWI